MPIIQFLSSLFPGLFASFLAVCLLQMVYLHASILLLLFNSIHACSFDRAFADSAFMRQRVRHYHAFFLVSRVGPFAFVAISAMIGTQSVLLAKQVSLLVLLSLRGQNQFQTLGACAIVLLWGLTTAFWLYRMVSCLCVRCGMFLFMLLGAAFCVGLLF